MIDQIPAAQQQLILIRLPDGAFRIADSQPLWFAELFPDDLESESFELAELFPFLELFLDDAERVWQRDLEGGADSDLWVETTQDDVPVHLWAQAIKVEGRDLLTVQPMDRVYRRLQESMQHGRDELNGFRRRDQEHDYKQTLLHCLVHDLVGSLSVAEVVFRSLQERPDLTPDEAESVDVGRNAMHSVSNQLRCMVDVFSAELKAVDYFETDPDFAPDILDCAMIELVNCGPAFRKKGIKVINEMPDDVAMRWPVDGEQSKLQRIFFNLLENALRYSPPEGKIRLTVEGDENHARLSVADDGPGVPEDAASKIFGRFSSDRRGGGKGGLGLYFAKLMIDRWGGRIGYEKAENGGARFWFELPRSKEQQSIHRLAV